MTNSTHNKFLIFYQFKIIKKNHHFYLFHFQEPNTLSSETLGWTLTISARPAIVRSVLRFGRAIHEGREDPKGSEKGDTGGLGGGNIFHRLQNRKWPPRSRVTRPLDQGSGRNMCGRVCHRPVAMIPWPDRKWSVPCNWLPSPINGLRSSLSLSSPSPASSVRLIYHTIIGG